MNYHLIAQLDQTVAALRDAYLQAGIEFHNREHRNAIAMTLTLLATSTPQEETTAHTLYSIVAYALGEPT